MPTAQIRADVAAAQDGDDSAFARLVDQTYSNVFLLAARLTARPRRRPRCCSGGLLARLPWSYRLSRRGEVHYMASSNHGQLCEHFANSPSAHSHDPIQRDVIDPNGEYHRSSEWRRAKISDDDLEKHLKNCYSLRSVLVLERRLRFVTPKNWQAIRISATAVKVRFHRSRKNAFDKPSKLNVELVNP